VVSWHSWYNPDPTRADFLEYPEFLRKIQGECNARGFKGEYMCTEFTWYAPYPPTAPSGDAAADYRTTEMQKAKYAARTSIAHLAANVHSFWCELFRQQSVQLSIGLLRNSFSSSPLCPIQPEPVYYVLRTLSTVMDEAVPTPTSIRFGEKDNQLEWYTFCNPDRELMLALWAKGYARDDDSQEIITDVTFPKVKLSDVSACDVINGDIQSLKVDYDGEDTILQDIHIKDWPIIISGQQS